MIITKFLQTCINRTLVTAGVLSMLMLSSCNNQSDTVLDDNLFLGSPKIAQLNARLIPNDWITKQLAIGLDTATNKDLSSNSFLKELFFQDNPSLQKLAENFVQLEPDLSKNWIISAGTLKETDFVSAYLSVGKSEKIIALFDEKNIIKKEENKGITILEVDKNASSRSFVLFDSKHILIVKSFGKEELNKSLIESCFYSSNDTYFDHFKGLFDKERNDLDISIINNDKVSKYLKLPIIQDLAKNFKGRISLNLKEDGIKLKINPLNSKTPLDSIFKPITVLDESKASFQTHIDLAKLKKFLVHYDYLDDIEYELKKGKINYSTLESLTDGRVQISFNGKVTSKEKSISYAYDDDFNQVEQSSYKTQESFDFSGEIGVKNKNTSLDFFKNNNYISATNGNNYEPIIGSKSKINFTNKEIIIGNAHDSKTNKDKLKLLLSLTDPYAIPKPAKFDLMLKVLKFNSAQLKIDTKNNIELELLFGGNAYSYLKKGVSFINPENIR